jgi:hypothetical protein
MGEIDTTKLRIADDNIETNNVNDDQDDGFDFNTL